MFTHVAHPDASTVVYSFSPLMLGLVFGGALVVTLLGVYLRLRTRLHPLGYGCAAFGLIGLALIGPMMALDRVVLTKSAITQTTGFWFAPTVKGFAFQGVDRIVIAPVRERRGERTESHWFIHRDNQVQEIDPGDLWDHNTDTIVPWIRECGIRITLPVN